LRARCYFESALVLAAVTLTVYAAYNSQIMFYGPFNVSNDAGSGSPWEPATGVGALWVHAYSDTTDGSGFGLYTAAWQSGGSWSHSPKLTGQCHGQSHGLGDPFLSYDTTRGRYVLVATDPDVNQSCAYFKTSTDGINWSNDPLEAILVGSSGRAYDYSSIAVDNTGRIIVGAVLYQNKGNTSQCLGYFVTIFSNGQWSAPIQVAFPNSGTNPAGDPNRWGIGGRVAAAGNQFYVFLPAFASGSQFVPLGAWLYTEPFTGAPSYPVPVANLSGYAPANNTPLGVSPAVYFAPLIDANGNGNGVWAVAFQAANGIGGANNVNVCWGTNTTVQQGQPATCYVVNQTSVFQFMGGVAVDYLGGLWVSYLGYSGGGYQTPLLHQTIYLVPNQLHIGSTGSSNIQPTSWLSVGFGDDADRCGFTCYAMGDYARIGVNQGNPNDPNNNPLGVSAPFVNFFQGGGTQLNQLFYYDPPGPPSFNSFTPNVIAYPPDAKWAGPIPPPHQPGSLGVAPELRRKWPGYNRQ